MKRPNSAPRSVSKDRPAKAAPRVPAQPAAKPAKAAKLAKPLAKPASRPARSAQPAAPVGRATGSLSNQRLKQEQRRLSVLAKIDRKETRSRTREQLSQIRRFTQANRTRRVVVLSLLTSVLALVGLVLATMFTPMMAIESIQVTGLHRLKAAQIQAAVKGLIGKPLTMVDESQLVSRLSGFSLIESFNTVSLPPHVLQLNIQERQPIGVVSVGGNNYLYDAAGVQISPVSSQAKYPVIEVNGNPAQSANYREAVDVLLALPASLYPSVSSIQATTKDDVRLTLRGVSNRQILWGDSSQSLLKSKVLAALMKNVKHTATVTFDVSSPSAPAVRYGAF